MKRIEHKKKLKHKQNQRYYKKVKAKRLQERKEKGDKKAYQSSAAIMKNYKRKKRLGFFMVDD